MQTMRERQGMNEDISGDVFNVAVISIKTCLYSRDRNCRGTLYIFYFIIKVRTFIILEIKRKIIVFLYFNCDQNYIVIEHNYII